MKSIKKIIAFICLLAVILQYEGISVLDCKASTATKENSAIQEQKAICFAKGGIAYRVIGNRKVEVVGFTKNKSVISIPEKVKYKNKSYKVTQVADMELHERDSAPPVYLEGQYAPSDYYPDEYMTPVSRVDILLQEEISCTKLILPKTLEYIGEGAFYDCKIQNVEFASKYKKLVIGKYTFGRRGPKTVIFPEGTKEIGDYATWHVNTISFPKSVKKIGSGVATYNTKKIKVHPKNKHFKMKSGMLYTKNEKGLIGITQKVAEKSKIKVSSKTNYMSDYVFAYCKAKKITLGGHVLEISRGAFDGCRNMTEVEGTETVKAIRYGAFDGCSSLQTIEDVSGVEIIEDAAFWETNKLTLPISAKMDIAPNAFAGTYIDSSSKMKIIIAENDPVYTVENGLMIKTKGDSKTIIRQVEQSESIEIPEGVTSIAVALGDYMARYKEVVFPESLKRHTGCVYIKDGTITYKSHTLPEFDRGFYICGNGTVVVPKGMLEEYKTSMEKAANKMSWEYEEGFYWDSIYNPVSIREAE